jgi:hypothetical protein
MHGTFRNRIENGAGVTVRFGASEPAVPRPRRWRVKLAALLAGCCVSLLPIATLPTAWRDGDRQTSARDKSPPQVVALAPVVPALAALPADAPKLAISTYVVATTVVAETPKVAISAPVAATAVPAETPKVAIAAPVAATIVPAETPKVAIPAPVAPAVSPPLEPVVLPDSEKIDGAAAADVPRLAVAPSASPPIAVDLPDTAPRLAVVERPAPSPGDTPSAPRPGLRPVDVMQVADSEVRSLRVPQLNAPGLAVGSGPVLSARIAAMQVTPLPPPRLRPSDRAALLAEAPTRMTLRIGKSALGKVDFHMTDAHTIDVKLSGLLDLLAGHYVAAEFARLRTSAAADAYVSFDQLRALGLNVRYDPAYDELRISG